MVLTQASAYSTACEFCPDECPTCTVLNEGDKVQVCQPVFAHTTSASADGTLESLEVEPSYWRMSNTSKDVRECFRKDACVGGTESYCAPGYTGPCEFRRDEIFYAPHSSYPCTYASAIISPSSCVRLRLALFAPVVWGIHALRVVSVYFVSSFLVAP